MKKPPNPLVTSSEPRRAPVRVRLQRINASLSKVHPPDGDGKIWWARLKAALGTASSDFVDASLYQLQSAAQMPCGGIWIGAGWPNCFSSGRPDIERHAHPPPDQTPSEKKPRPCGRG
jgi:hypothetical protein